MIKPLHIQTVPETLRDFTQLEAAVNHFKEQCKGTKPGLPIPFHNTTNIQLYLDAAITLQNAARKAAQSLQAEINGFLLDQREEDDAGPYTLT